MKHSKELHVCLRAALQIKFLLLCHYLSVWLLLTFSFIWIFSSTFWKRKWKRETRSVLLIAVIMICLQNRAVGYIYHLTAFCECWWWRAEQTFLCEIHTHIHKEAQRSVLVCVCVCVSVRIQTLTDYCTGLHNDTSFSISIHHLSVCC